VKAADISDAQIVCVVIAAAHALHQSVANRHDVAVMLSEFPSKVVHSKLRQAALKGLLTGCKDSACVGVGACRGDYAPTSAGLELLVKPVQKKESHD
jgi:hypothetical protein